jgi:hypothetical protein
MAWIKIEASLPDKPEVVSLAAALKMDRDGVVGRLFRLWTWADANHITGESVPVTGAFLDELCRRRGFAQALRSVGWLGGQDGALTFPNFARHNGKEAKKRALVQMRVAKHRERESNDNHGNAFVTQEPLQGCNASSVTKALPPSSPAPAPALPPAPPITPPTPSPTNLPPKSLSAGEELLPVKRTTRKSEAKPQGEVLSRVSIVESIYYAYPKLTGKGRALQEIERAIKGGVAWDVLLERTQAYGRAVREWPPAYRYTRDGRDLCPHPATWFHQRRWEDDEETWRPLGGGEAESLRERLIREAEEEGELIRRSAS